MFLIATAFKKLFKSPSPNPDWGSCGCPSQHMTKRKSTLDLFDFHTTHATNPRPHHHHSNPATSKLRLIWKYGLNCLNSLNDTWRAQHSKACCACPRTACKAAGPHLPSNGPPHILRHISRHIVDGNMHIHLSPLSLRLCPTATDRQIITRSTT